MSRRLSPAVVVLLYVLLGLTPAAVSAFANGQAASLVLGQANFTSSDYATAATSMHAPIDVATDPSGSVWVADNNRVLEFVFAGATNTSVSCSPSTVASGSTTTCTATVAGSSPTGNVTWSSSSGTPNFSAGGACTLTSGSCLVMYNDSTSGAPAITASYGGDINNLASLGSYILANFSPAATAAESNSTSTSAGGSASADQQGTTGVSVSISGAPVNTAITIFSADLPSQLPGTGTLSVSELGFYDVRIGGITSGTANVCIFSSQVDAITLMQYYYGGTWDNATNIVVTPGSKMCGDIPVADLTGTPLVIGDPETTITQTQTVTQTVTSTLPASTSTATSTATQSVTSTVTSTQISPTTVTSTNTVTSPTTVTSTQTLSATATSTVTSTKTSPATATSTVTSTKTSPATATSTVTSTQILSTTVKSTVTSAITSTGTAALYAAGILAIAIVAAAAVISVRRGKP